MPASAEVEKKALEVALRGGTYTAPTKAYLALCEVEPKRTWNGKELGATEAGKELSYGNYKRTEVKLEAATWKVKAGTETEVTKLTNEAAIEIPASNKTEGNENAKFFALCEKEKASETGIIYFYGKLTSELKITTSITKVEFKAGELEITAE